MGTDLRSGKTQTLLREFDRTAELVRPFVADRVGEAGADAIHSSARAHFVKIIPQIPHIEGFRARALNGFLLITAQEIAVYKAIRDRGGSPAEAWEICHEAIRLRMKDFPMWRRWLYARLMYSAPIQRLMKRREETDQRGRFGDFELRYHAGDGRDYHIGVDYVRCGNFELAKRLDAEEFAPYICMSDIALSDALGWGLIRTQTLADGCSHCDFRFKKSAPTQICSKTPEVQETIERIEQRTRSTQIP